MALRTWLALPLLPAFAALGIVGACRGSAPDVPYDSGPPYVATYHPLDSDGHVLRDASGRTVILRGYNVKVRGLFDGVWDGGPEILPTLDDADFALMQASGVNVLRVPVNWNLFEPQQGTYDDSYLAAIDTFLDQVRPYGFYVLLDFHEDGWSKTLCEDGAADWATVVSPGQDGGAPGADCHASNAALSAHQNFLQYDAKSLQEAFAAMYQQFAAHFVNEQLVFGYEIFNEPVAGDAFVDAFSIKLARTIRQVDPGHLILWEPSAYRNLLNGSFVSDASFPVAGGVYAVHIYTDAYGFAFPRSIANARTEADSWGEPLFVTEHGASPVEGGPEGGLGWVSGELDGFDQNLASSMDWIWNPGVVTRSEAGAVIPTFGGSVLQRLTRPYAMAVGGDVTQTTWDGATLTVGFTAHPGVPFTHDVYWNFGTPTVTCDGETLTGVVADLARLVYTVTCGGGGSHTLVFTRGS